MIMLSMTSFFFFFFYGNFYSLSLRNKAIKALDERLQKAQSVRKESEEWPEMDDDKQPPTGKSSEDTISTSSSSSKSDIVRIDVEPSSPSDENQSH